MVRSIQTGPSPNFRLALSADGAIAKILNWPRLWRGLSNLSKQTGPSSIFKLASPEVARPRKLLMPLSLNSAVWDTHPGLSPIFLWAPPQLAGPQKSQNSVALSEGPTESRVPWGIEALNGIDWNKSIVDHITIMASTETNRLSPLWLEGSRFPPDQKFCLF